MFSELKKLDKEKQQPLQKEEVITQLAPLSPTPSIVHKEEKSNCQLNAWITMEQDLLCTNALYKLKANRVKVKKGELLGVAIEVISRILENQIPTILDASILDNYVKNHAKQT